MLDTFAIGQTVRVLPNAFTDDRGNTLPSWIDFTDLRGKTVTIIDMNQIILVAIDAQGNTWGFYRNEVEEVKE